MAYDYLAAVAEIQRRYPPARIAASRARLLAVWNGDGPEPAGPGSDGIPFIFTGVPNTLDANGGMLYEARYPREELLAYHLEAILARAGVEDDYIPSLFPGCRQGLIPTAYGAREEWTSDHYWLAPLLASAEEVDGLPQPDLSRDGVAAEILENTRFFRHATQGGSAHPDARYAGTAGPCRQHAGRRTADGGDVRPSGSGAPAARTHDARFHRLYASAGGSCRGHTGADPLHANRLAAAWTRHVSERRPAGGDFASLLPDIRPAL